MTPKSTIALEAAGSGPGRPGPQLPGPCEGVAGDDRLAALFAAAEARHAKTRRVVATLLRWLVYVGALLTTLVLLFLVGYILSLIHISSWRIARGAAPGTGDRGAHAQLR